MNRSVWAVGALVVVGAAVAVVAWQSGSAPNAPEAEGLAEPEPEAVASAPVVDAPNVLVVMWDTARADRMSLYGHERPTTPRLDAWAAENAVVFDQAVSPSFWTIPSHGSLFTGLPVTSHGANAHRQWLVSAHTTLAEWLGEQGYDTYAFTVNPNIHPSTNFSQGFDVLDSPESGWLKKEVLEYNRSKMIPEDASTPRSPRWREGQQKGAKKDAGPWAEKAMVKWLDGRDPQRPWFAYLNYMEVHHPRLPTQAARDAVIDDPELQRRMLSAAIDVPRIKEMNRGEAPEPWEVEAFQATYDAAMHDLDRVTSDLLVTLEARGDLDDTIVVIVSDHGENLGDHDLWGHNYALYNSLVHVPLIVSYPKRLKPMRVFEPVTTMDLFGTVLDLAGLPAPEGPGRFASWFAATPRRHVYSELTAAHGSRPRRAQDPDEELRRGDYRYRAVIRGMHKLIVSNQGETELFDWVSDPDELLPIDDPALTRALNEKGDQWYRGLSRPRPRHWQEDRRLRESFADRDKGSSAADRKAALEALGYVE